MVPSLGDSLVYRTAYGVILNTRAERDRLGEALKAAPYKAPPQAPVLYVKPANTFNTDGSAIEIPGAQTQLEVHGTVAVLIGRQATRVSEADALAHVAAYVPVMDVCEPHDVYFRPAVRQRCRDGFLPIGQPVAADGAGSPDTLEVSIAVNGVKASSWSTAQLVRPVAQLIADVTDFMTLSAGDLLIVGVGAAPVHVTAGQRVEVSLPGFASLSAGFVSEGGVA